MLFRKENLSGGPNGRNCFMLSLRVLTYGCAREVWRAQGKRKVDRGVMKLRRSYNSLVSTQGVG